MSKQRACKLQEFTAHAGAVNGLRIGRKSGRVMVTGGDDRKVNVWAIARPNAIMSLTGHTSAVECVAFDAAEEVVVAGSAGGTLKLWDLQEKKVVRTLNGHKSNCNTVDFHPCGEFFASGSLDTHLKIWDVRRKGCIQTYKGHSKAVNIVRFSPDGRWVVSGGEDGVIKVWDLTAGKLLHDLPQHSGPVTALDFHPNEFLLASGSDDGGIRFWDLEMFEMVSSTGERGLDKEHNQRSVYSLSFTQDGRALLAGYHNNLCGWGWEPATCLDTIPADWNGLCDMTIVNDQLIACSKENAIVSVWAVNLSRMRLTSETTAVSAVVSNINGRM